MKTERVFADTNLFLRYLTNDVPEQADAFERLMWRAAKGEVTLVINSLVIAEIVWTLESFYGLAPDQVQEKIQVILNAPGLELEDSSLVLQAVLWHVEKSVDFIDAYNAAWMIEHGIETIQTFDRRRFSRFEGIQVIAP